MNNSISAMIETEPKDAIKRYTVPLNKTHPKENVLPEDGLYGYVYQPSEQYEDKKKRATDINLSENTYQLDRIVEEPGNHVLYNLQDEPDKAFVSKELMHISKDTQVPPEWVTEWK